MLSLLQACAVPFGHVLSYLVPLHLESLGLCAEPLLGRLHGLVGFLSSALLLSVGADDLLAAIVGVERTMVDHPLEAVVLSLIALSVHPGSLVDDHRNFDRCSSIG